MTWSPIVWHDDDSPDLEAVNLNNINEGIQQALDAEEDAEAKIEVIETTLEETKTKLDTLEVKESSDVSGINSTISGIKTDLGSLQNDLNSVSSDLGTVKSQVSQAQTDINNIRNDLADKWGGVSETELYNATDSDGNFWFILVHAWGRMRQVYIKFSGHLEADLYTYAPCTLPQDYIVPFDTYFAGAGNTEWAGEHSFTACLQANGQICVRSDGWSGDMAGHDACFNATYIKPSWWNEELQEWSNVRPNTNRGNK